jgi:hypothetical protein
LGRRFTWSKNQGFPTLSRIDKAFCSAAWENLYANPALQALSSSTLDQCPLLLAPFISPPTKPRFRFEKFWVHMPDFTDVVSEAWSRTTCITCLLSWPETCTRGYWVPTSLAMRECQTWSSRALQSQERSCGIWLQVWYENR